MSAKLVVQPVEGTFSLKEHIYEVLKDAITSMNIYADDADLRLDERQLSEQFKISRTPIREALARLEQEGTGDNSAPQGCVYSAQVDRRESWR